MNWFDIGIRLAIGFVGLIVLCVAARSCWRQRGQDPARLADRRDSGEHLDGREGAIRRTERVVRFSEGSALDYRSMLKPRLAAVASRRLGDAGIDLVDGDAVESLLGPEAARIIDPLEPPPERRDARGVPATTVRDLLRRLDQLR